MKHVIFVVFIFLAFAAVSNAQEGKLPEGGTAFLQHKVQQGETIFSISKKYAVEQKDLLFANPELVMGLKAGQNLKIPVAGEIREQLSEPVTQLNRAPLSGPVNQESLPSFEEYNVKRNDSLYFIAKRFGIEVEDILKYNPEARDGLEKRHVLRIPDKDDLAKIRAQELNRAAQPKQAQRVAGDDPLVKDSEKFLMYVIPKGETFCNLEKKYQITRAELEALNPALRDGLKTGLKIKIPLKKVPEIQVVPVDEQNFEDHTICQPDIRASKQTYQIGLLLPLYLPANDTINRVRVTREEMMKDSLLMSRIGNLDELPADSFRRRDDVIVYPRSENFIHFYEGVLLAADSMKQAGMHVQLHVFDTNQKRYVVDSLVRSGSLRGLDLIIGPTFTELQKSVADFALQNRIPMISPLSSSGNFEEQNPWYFKVNPTKQYLIQKTADYIVDEFFDKNIIILRMGEYSNLPEAELVKLVREKLLLSGYRDQFDKVLFHEYRLPANGPGGLKELLSRDQENIFIIPSETEAQISVAVTTLNALAEEYPVTLVGLSNFQRYKSIQTEYFHSIKLNYLTPYFVNYESPAVNQFIRKFRLNFAAEPNQYSFQGYDVAFYFMSALFRYGKDFTGCLPMLKVSLTQSELAFDKVNRDGGYMNRGLFIMQYERDYDVTMKGITGILPHVSAGK